MWDVRSSTWRWRASTRLWSLHSKLEIPLAHVAGARVDPAAVRAAACTGIKAGGARVGHLIAGTFRQEGE